jgi:hypothetical protein
MVSGHSWKQAARTTTRNQSLQQGHNVLVLQVPLCDDTAFILLSRGEVIAASKLIVSHFRRFGLTIHTGSREKGEDSKTEAIHFPRPGQESSAADMEDIEIDADRFMSFASSSNT